MRLSLLISAVLLASPVWAIEAPVDAAPEVKVEAKIDATIEAKVEPKEPQRLCANVGLNTEPREQCIALDNYPQDVCTQVAAAAKRHGLEVGFFARLIWKESLFNANARSHMGAEGIAQFIPSTARLRGLQNSYNPVEALDKSASYLVELSQRFGSLGMAAVAYNAGEGRAGKYLASGGFMPYETQDYVMTITGQSVETWKRRPAMEIDYALVPGKDFMPSCLDMVARKPFKRFENRETVQWSPYGVQLGAHVKRAFAQRIFKRVQQDNMSILGNEKPLILHLRNRGMGSMLRYTVRIGRPNRAEAIKLCRRLRDAGAICTVQRNPR